MRTWIAVLLLVGLAGAEEMTGVLVKSGPNQIEMKVDHDPRIVKLELKPGTKVPCKVGQRIWVDYTAQRVAVEQNGQRQCLQFLTANLIKPASGGHP